MINKGAAAISIPFISTADTGYLVNGNCGTQLADGATCPQHNLSPDSEKVNRRYAQHRRRGGRPQTVALTGTATDSSEADPRSAGPEAALPRKH